MSEYFKILKRRSVPVFIGIFIGIVINLFIIENPFDILSELGIGFLLINFYLFLILAVGGSFIEYKYKRRD